MSPSSFARVPWKSLNREKILGKMWIAGAVYSPISIICKDIRKLPRGAAGFPGGKKNSDVIDSFEPAGYKQLPSTDRANSALPFQSVSEN